MGEYRYERMKSCTLREKTNCRQHTGNKKKDNSFTVPVKELSQREVPWDREKHCLTHIHIRLLQELTDLPTHVQLVESLCRDKS